MKPSPQRQHDLICFIPLLDCRLKLHRLHLMHVERLSSETLLPSYRTIGLRVRRVTSSVVFRTFKQPEWAFFLGLRHTCTDRPTQSTIENELGFTPFAAPCPGGQYHYIVPSVPLVSAPTDGYDRTLSCQARADQ